jgi:flagellum-specific peptidoglycan hydrolase FlgJ
MRILFCLILSIIFLSIRAQTDYFNKYKPLADSLSEKYEVPSCIILCVGFLESGGGKSKVAKVLNNHFGIVGKNNLHKKGRFESKYKYFYSVSDSYNSFCKLITSKSYYSTLKGNNNIDKWAIAIASKGYAENANLWSSYIIKLAKKQCK